jgi:hypothetical protein
MDGLEDSSNNHNVSNTDTSQDEVDASSPSGKYKRFGRHGAGLNGAAGADASAGIHRSPQGTHAAGTHPDYCPFPSAYLVIARITLQGQKCDACAIATAFRI